MAQRRVPSGPRKGQFAKVTNLPDKLGKQSPKGRGGGIIVQTVSGLGAASEVIGRVDKRAKQALLNDPDRRAADIQASMRAGALAQYTRAATGRFARGIYAKVQKVGTADGAGVETAIVVTMINYRESNFLTNLGNGGIFKSFPVGPYRIFAKGVEDISDLNDMSSRSSTRKAIGFIKRQGVGRLKVPRATAFFTASRQQGRGGGESRSLSDVQEGPIDFKKKSKQFPNLSAKPKGDYFFYPLWVNHPGFSRDILSEIALKEGASFTTEVTDKTMLAWSELRAERVEGAARLPESDVVVSNIIPLPNTAVYLSRKGTTTVDNVPAFLLKYK